MRPQLIVDVETTSLKPDYADGSGVIWELAIANRATGDEHLYRMLPDLAKADVQSLQVNKFYEATRLMRKRDERVYNLAGQDLDKRGGAWSNPAGVAAVVAPMLAGATIIASNPLFDTGFIADFLRHHGQSPAWSYRIRDFASMAYGYLSACLNFGTEGLDCVFGRPDIDSGTADFARALGIDTGQYVAHSAMDDVRLLMACLDVIEGRRP